MLGFVVLILPAYTGNSLFQLVIFLASFALLAYFAHCLTHYIVGKIVGLNFSHYVFGTSQLKQVNSTVNRTLDSVLPRLGIRLTPQSRMNANPTQRLLVFSSGVAASTLVTLIPTFISYTIVTYPLNALLPIIWIGYLVFGVYFSPRYGDLSHIKSKPER